jgi:hypothetical protein
LEKIKKIDLLGTLNLHKLKANRTNLNRSADCDLDIHLLKEYIALTYICAY